MPLDPTSWKVIAQEGKPPTRLMLGDHVADSYRIGLTLRDGDDGREVAAMIVYPCGACGWNETCDEDEGGCHV